MLSIYEWCAIPLILGSSVGAIIYGVCAKPNLNLVHSLVLRHS